MTSSFERSSDLTSSAAKFCLDPLEPITSDADFVVTDVVGGTMYGGKFACCEAAWPEASELAAAAFDAGYGAGRAELPWAKVESLERSVEAFEVAAARLEQLRSKYLHTHRRAVIELALAVAEKLVRREVQADRDALVGVLDGALEALGDRIPVRLLLSPKDHLVIAQGFASKTEGWLREHSMEVEVEDSLESGDVRLVSDCCEVDARVPELIERLREELAEFVEAEEDL